MGCKNGNSSQCVAAEVLTEQLSKALTGTLSPTGSLSYRDNDGHYYDKKWINFYLESERCVTAHISRYKHQMNRVDV